MELTSRSTSVYGGLGPTGLRTGYALISIVTFLLLLRVYVRYAITRHGGWALLWAWIAWVSERPFRLEANRRQIYRD